MSLRFTNLSSARPNSLRAPNPPILPELELIERIGSGGYGEVWLCRNVVGTLRAVKIVRRAEFDDERPYEREFNGIRKFEPISRTHEGFVNILQIGRNEPEGFFYYVMELADNSVPPGMESRLQSADRSPASTASKTPSPEPAKAGTTYFPRTLASEVKARGALPLPECVTLAIPLVQALAELHRHGLVHRDIKPSNIIFVNGAPKLADIGLVASATDSRSFVGTEGYIPPEGPGSVQADLYSLGIVLYVLATGQHHRDFPEPPTDLLSRSDRDQLLELTALIHKATQTNPRDRYQSATALLADLKRLTAGRSIKRRHALQTGFSLTWKAAAVLALLSLILFLIKNERDKRATLARLHATPFENSGTTNLLAWQTMQRALRMGGNTYTAVGLLESIPELEKAIALDPNYVSAWSMLSMTFILAVTEGYLPGTNGLARARNHLEQAIKLNPLDQHFGVQAECNLALDYDFSKAEPLFRKAIALAGGSWIAQNNFGWELIYQGQFTEAEQIFSHITQEFPQGGTAYIALGLLYCATGRQTEGLAQFDTGIPLEPDRPRWRLLRGDVLWASGQRREGSQDFLRQIELGGVPSLDRQIDAATLLQTLNQRGPEAFVNHFITMLEARQTTGDFVSAFDLARLYAHADNSSRALDNLEIAVAEHRGLLLSLKVNPAFKNLRYEPRYDAVLRQLHLEK